MIVQAMSGDMTGATETFNQVLSVKASAAMEYAKMNVMGGVFEESFDPNSIPKFGFPVGSVWSYTHKSPEGKVTQHSSAVKVPGKGKERTENRTAMVRKWHGEGDIKVHNS